jgi:hypothetical protein
LSRSRNRNRKPKRKNQQANPEEVQAKLKAVKAEQRAKQAEAKGGNDNAAKQKTIVVQSGQVLNHKPKPEAKSRAVIAGAAKVSKTAVARAEALAYPSGQ